jgi:hypothetical protein
MEAALEACFNANIGNVGLSEDPDDGEEELFYIDESSCVVAFVTSSVYKQTDGTYIVRTRGHNGKDQYVKDETCKTLKDVFIALISASAFDGNRSFKILRKMYDLIEPDWPFKMTQEQLSSLLNLFEESSELLEKLASIRVTGNFS